MTNKELNEKVLTCDEEAWLLGIIENAIEMGIALRERKNSPLSEAAYKSGIRGITNGAAYQVINTLGLRSEMVNITYPFYHSANEGKEL